MAKCPTCKSDTEVGEFVPRISDGEECEECGRPHCFEKLKLSITVVSESGKKRSLTKTVGYQGDTPLEAINVILEEFSGPRGPRVVSIDRIQGNVTPLLSAEEIGERSVLFEETGVVTHNITLQVDK